MSTPKPLLTPRRGTPARPLARRLSSRQYIADLLAAPELAQLDAITPAFDPLEVLAWTHQERPHTRFLAWLLDPRDPRPGGGHGLGASVLRALIERAVSAVETLPGLESASLPRSLARIDPAAVSVLREAPLGDGVRVTARAPDIRCTWRDATGASWVVLVENKIDAAEGDGQVRDYLAWAARHHPDARRMLLYVTPDGRAPDSVTLGEVVVAMTWSDVADAALEAIARAPHAGDPSARSFATSVLEALRMRFGGRSDVRALLESLHEAHPRGAALAASPATEPSLIEPIQQRFPHAHWHLRTLRPRAHRWTRAWAEHTAACFRALAPWAPALRPCAPHAERPDMASWSIDGVTDALALYAFCTAGTLFGSHRPRAWIALRAPNQSPREVFTAREQLGLIDALPDETRGWILAAAPVMETPASWRWLSLGAPVVLSRAYSMDDDARRTAKAFHELLAPHLDALSALSRDASQRLYSCDLDLDHALPADARDRAVLHRDARADACRALIVTRQPTGHPYELRRECELGAALSVAFGGSASLCYDYAPAASLGLVTTPQVVVVATSLFRAPDDGSLRESVAVVHEALAAGAWLLVCGDRGDFELARRHLGALLSPLVGPAQSEELTGSELEVQSADPRFDALSGRDARWVQGVLGLRVRDGVSVPMRVRATSPGRAGELLPLVAGWRSGGARVVFWAGGAVGPWGRALQQRPEALARWWQSLVAFAATL